MAGEHGRGWVLVTGATGGLGAALVAHLVARGYRVIAAAREPARIAVPPGSGRIVPLALDITVQASIDDAVRKVAAIVTTEGLYGLVNMAGVIVEGPLEAISPEAFRNQLDINVLGPFALTQALLPLLKLSRGRIVNIGAISAHLTAPFYGPIAASKSALASLSDAMRLEFGQFGIEVILIEPGAMKTGIFATSQAFRDRALSARRDLERHYRPALTAMDKAFEKSGSDNPSVVAKAILKALEDRRPRPRLVVGKGTGALLFLARLPTRTRDRLVKNALGLSRELKPKPR